MSMNIAPNPYLCMSMDIFWMHLGICLSFYGHNLFYIILMDLVCTYSVVFSILL